MYEENTFELYAYLFLGWALSTLSAVAAVTNGIRLGTSILNIVVRSPVICVKSLAAIDILSSGRLFERELGLVHIKETMMSVEFRLKRGGVDLMKH